MIPIHRQLLEIKTRNATRVDSTRDPVGLFDVRGDYAFVLLGDPGLGKTTVFKQESEILGAVFVSARDFLELGHDPADFRDTVLFIDALDETRAWTRDGRTVISQIRQKLVELGVPKFRLSCREADWLGDSDRDALAKIVQNRGELRVYRLQPLSEAGILTLLKDAFNVGDPSQFVRHAEQMGVEALLRNPQTLKMLAKAVGSGSLWPDSRARMYELACNTLVIEPNQEHQNAKRKSWPNTSALLDAAGLISAVFLCADRSEIQLSRDDSSDPKALLLNEIVNGDHLPLGEVTETKLFTAIHEGRSVPAHRSIAEFLAARYLAQRLKNGLSPARASSLMLGADRGVITSLRGLNAWLATCAPLARARCIHADPQGVLLYGDIKAFTTSDKVLLLRCLRQRVAEDQWRNSDDWNSSALGALATPEMAEALTAILRAPERERFDQAMADLVVTALSYGRKIDGVEGALLDVARDASRWSGMRRFALRAYLKKYIVSDAVALTLFDDVTTGRVADDDDELLGILLRYLYPKKLSIPRVLECSRAPKAPSWMGSFWRFWNGICLQETSAEQLPELLNTLSKKAPLGNSRGNETHWRFAGESLVRGLETLGDDTDDERLYVWLGVTFGELERDHLSGELRQRLHEWLRMRPTRFLRLLQIAIQHLGQEDRLWRALRRLHDPKWPTRVATQLLALADAESRAQIADDLFWAAARGLYEPSADADLSFEKLETWVAKHSRFAHAFEQFRYWAIDDWRIEEAARNAEERREATERIQQYRTALLAKPAAECNIQGLHHLALAHVGYLSEAKGDTPVDRLRDFLGNDETLVAKAIAAIDATCTRSDLPMAEQILSSYLNNKEWLLARPLLVNLDRMQSCSLADIFKLDESVLSAALMASYAAPVERDVSFRKLLAVERPTWVASVFINYAVAALKAGKSTLTGAHELTDDKSFSAVAQLVLPEVLSRFPRRASVEQLYDLARFIKSFVATFTEREVLALVTQKLALKTLDVGQRTYWLAAGLLLAPKEYEPRLRAWADGNEIRVGHLGNFLDRRDQVIGDFEQLPASVIGLLLELLAPHSRPDRPVGGGAYQVTPDMQRGNLIASWISDLSSRPSADAAAALARLQTLPSLLPWFNALGTARAAQTIVQRDATYQFALPSDVVATLAQGKPANVADLHAIVIDNLQQIATEIERSDLDIYKQYWNTDSNNNPVTPKIEEAARDALCLLLRERLARHEVSCAPEARHADQKRSDMLCCHQTFCVPVEVKNQMHPDIWKAIRDQLADKYTTDPRAGGYGVYVVFWFGPSRKLTSATTGRKPKTASELRAALVLTLSAAQRKSIAICVIDVSVEGRRG